MEADRKLYRNSLNILTLVGVLAGVVAGVAVGALWFTAAAIVEVLREMKRVKGVEIEIPK